MNDSIKELIAIGASVGAHCQPCLEFHIQAAIELGLSRSEIEQAIDIGHKVEKGAMVAMKKFSEETLKDFSALHTAGDNPAIKSTVAQNNNLKVLKIYDPAMCCSSGVCGPSVDPVLTQFATTLKHLETQPGIRIERYNLGQQPQAFVENTSVKSMLGNGGEKELPFMFIDDQFWLKGRYPSRTELLDALKIKSDSLRALFPGEKGNASCCGNGECC